MRMTLAALVLCVWPAFSIAGPDFWKHEWPDTNFTKTSVEKWVEILSGGPPKDGIPAIDSPGFLRASVETRISGREPVITLEIGTETARAYPLRYLTWHEIVNDTIGGVPVAVTFCPLCNSAMVFDRRTEAGTLSFGVSGKLRNSDMVMYDRETQSWWQQALGEAIVGDLTGTQLRHLPTWMESFDQFRARNPDGLVMDQPAASRQYGRNPYEGYDTSARPFLYSGENPPHGIHPLERVVRVGNRAWPMTRLAGQGALQEDGVVLTWETGQASALDTAHIPDGREVGTVRVRDESGSDLAHDVLFAFAFHAFWPDGRWMLSE